MNPRPFAFKVGVSTFEPQCRANIPGIAKKKEAAQSVRGTGIRNISISMTTLERKKKFTQKYVEHKTQGCKWQKNLSLCQGVLGKKEREKRRVK